MEFSRDLLTQVQNLPEKPGVYIMFDSSDVVIYVGKARSLKNRVSGYFREQNVNPLNPHSVKTSIMVQSIARFEYIITDTELEALVLECNLIKKHMPKYNILLKDGKAFPYIKVTVNEPFPKIFLTRQIKKDGAKYFGPYLNTNSIREMIDIAKKVFLIRTCNKNLPRDIGKGRECLNFAMKQCAAPCVFGVGQEEYRSLCEGVCDFLSGNNKHITEMLGEKMAQASAKLDFEQAAKLRDRLMIIKNMEEKQKIVSVNAGNQDVIALAANDKDVCLQVFFIRGGKLNGRETYFFRQVTEAADGEIIGNFMKQYYSMSAEIPQTVILQHSPEDIDVIRQWIGEKAGAAISIVVPKRGEKLMLVKMVENNALEALQQQYLKYDTGAKKANELLYEVKQALGLPKMPLRIEAYDVSNVSGAANVGVCVVYENAAPRKRDYKKFNIRNTDGVDDYESMKEMLYRRITNALENEEGFTPLPDLIFVDGGKGHVSSAMKITEHFGVEIPIFGIVKDDKHRTRAVTTTTQEVAINRSSRLFAFLTQIQDEMHRFAIASHRKLHGKRSLHSQLEDIKGIGQQKRKKLLEHFGDVEKIKTAEIEQLTEVRGISERDARAVMEFFKNGVNSK